MQVKKQQLELDMEQQTGSKSEKEFIKAAYGHPWHCTAQMPVALCSRPRNLVLTPDFAVTFRSGCAASLVSLLALACIVSHYSFSFFHF